VLGRFLRAVLAPFGYLAFVLALVALSVAAKLLGDQNELGFFSARLARMIWRYPSVTRPGVQIAWLVWAALLVICVTPVDPLHTALDQFALIAAALVVVWRRVGDGSRAGR
jgi:hypothetical protein